MEEIHQCSSRGDEVGDPIGMGLDFDIVVAEVLNVEVGTGAADSGATLLVVGMKYWKRTGFECHGLELTRRKSSMTGATNFFFCVVARRFPQRVSSRCF